MDAAVRRRSRPRREDRRQAAGEPFPQRVLQCAAPAIRFDLAAQDAARVHLLRSKSMSMSLESAAQAYRDAMRQTVKRYSLWYLIEGVLLVVTGVLAIVFPVVSSAAVVVLLGWLLIVSGALQGISLIGAGHVPHFWLQLISVILAVLVGLLFLRDPAQGMLTITLLLIVFFMIEGISKVVFSLTIRPFPNWGGVLASGLVGLLLSAILWANLPVTAVWLIGLLLGIELISVGAAMAYLAWHVRQS